MDIHGQDLSLQLSRLLLLGFGGLFVFLDVELSQQHDGLLSEDAAGDWIGLVDAGAMRGSVIAVQMQRGGDWRTRSGY